LALYSLLKRFTSLCHFGIGLCLALAPLGAYVATSKSLPLNSDIIYLAGFTFFWMSGFDIIYSIMDITSDRITGVKSLPVKFGEKNA
ncbi:TPA: 4-hydroxybenzoate octaprenyltransferase, partial [bacterium]|nr:4-hydroxybenzoate octaprenyltransferase [bacterium]